MTNQKEANRKIWMAYFKYILKQCKSQDMGFVSWKETFGLVSELIRIHESERVLREFKNSDTMRRVLWTPLQEDYRWVEENGWPISKNSVGIKLTQDPDEVKEFIQVEYGRAMSLLKKVSVFKGYVKADEVAKGFGKMMEALESMEEPNHSIVFAEEPIKEAEFAGGRWKIE